MLGDPTLIAAPPGPHPSHDPAAVGLVAIDIDGTLTAVGDEVSKRVRRALANLAASGVHPVLATGRSVSGMMAAAHNSGLRQGWAVCSNGAVIVRLDPTLPSGHEVTDAVTFHPREALDVLRNVLPTAVFAVEDVGHGWRMTRPFPAGELYGEHTYVSYEELVSDEVTRAIVRAVELERAELAAIVAAVDMPLVSWEIGWSAWMDIVAPGVSKASGLERVRRRLGVPLGGTVAVGDGTNDISMLCWASRAAAMGGASPDVLAAATEECPPPAADGVAHLIDSVLAGIERGPAGSRH
jgi:Cof subfamily protein (haloacid dehalogenase superfamily)